ncbi:hypothetical protein [Sediminibacillus massiliensis]|uniref:hypothetical protein n=1 Tax=Sediminibacillus massiliensis TaxID=1926277 RepID=UPI0009886F42|nr:hypothetical protein [Sediminibacillus massiliensis]
MPYFRRDNVILQEDDKGKIKELKAMGYQEADKNGKIVEEQQEKTVAESTHKKVLKENKELKAKVEELEKSLQEAESANKQENNDNASSK